MSQLEGQDFVVFSDDWGRHPSSCQHLFRLLGERNRVLWVETIGLRAPRLTRQDLRRVGEKLGGWLRPQSLQEAVMWAEPPAQLKRCSPPMHPFYGRRPGAWLNDAWLARVLRRRLDAEGMRRPILLTTVPNAAGLLGRLGERLAVYYCVDDFAHWPGYGGDAIRRMEGQLIAGSDALVVTARTLVEGRQRSGVPLLELPHGVDLAHFAQPAAEPAAMAGIPRPRILSLGLYDERIDASLLAEIARSRPRWHFVFVGRRTAGANALDGMPNVHVLPGVSYQDVPAQLAAADLLLIPYVRNAQTDAINPLKLREFLASGRPVAATAMPEVVRAGGALVPTGDGVEGLRSAIEDALGRPASEAEARRALVAEHDWTARVESLSAFLAPLLR